MFVPQQEAWVVERMGKFHRVLDPGVNVLVPVLDRVKYVQSLKEIAIDIPQQSAITIGEFWKVLVKDCPLRTRRHFWRILRMKTIVFFLNCYCTTL